MTEPEANKPTSAEPPHFRRRHRLSKDRDFQRVFDARMRKTAGPMTLYTRPNGLLNSRLGLSVGRRVGNAVRRNRLKRLIREAFRLNRPHFPAPYDMVVVLRPHTPLGLADYAHMLKDCLGRAHEEWQRRAERERPHDT